MLAFACAILVAIMLYLAITCGFSEQKTVFCLMVFLFSCSFVISVCAAIFYKRRLNSQSDILRYRAANLSNIMMRNVASMHSLNNAATEYYETIQARQQQDQQQQPRITPRTSQPGSLNNLNSINLNINGDRQRPPVIDIGTHRPVPPPPPPLTQPPTQPRPPKPQPRRY